MTVPIQLHLVIYRTEDGDRFRAHAKVHDAVDVLVDVTDQYEVMAASTDDGRKGFLVVRNRGEDDGDVAV